MSEQQGNNGTKTCTHSPGDDWEDGCCGQDALAQNTQKAIQQSKNEVETRNLISSVTENSSGKEVLSGTPDITN